MTINLYKCDQQNKLVSYVYNTYLILGFTFWIVLSFFIYITFFGVKADKRYLKSEGSV